MNILTINALQSGGAAIASQQLHEALTNYGHSCIYSCLDCESITNKSLNYISPNDATAMSLIFQYWNDLTSPATREDAACELFSDSTPSILVCALSDEVIQWADIVHIHWMAGILFSPELIRLLRHKKIVWTLHDMNPFTGGCHYHISCNKYEDSCGSCPLLNKPAPNDLSALTHMIKRKLYAGLDLNIVTPSAWLSSLTIRSSLFSEFTPITIPNAHDTSKFRPLDRLKLRAEMNIPEDVFVILAGTENFENPRKNMIILQDALEIFSQRYQEIPFTLVLFGQGTWPPASYDIQHMGTTNREALPPLYNIADVFVHPSRLDNLSNSLCEAQCCGTPVIAFNAGGNNETFLDQVSGFTVAQSPEAFAETLYTFYSNKNTSMRTNARKFAHDKFAYEQVAKQYTQLYENIIQTKSQRADFTQIDNILVSNALDALLRMQIRNSEIVHELRNTHLLTAN